MAYKMTDLSVGLRIGRKTNGTFDIEYNWGEESLYLDTEDAEKVANYILQVLGKQHSPRDT